MRKVAAALALIAALGLYAALGRADSYSIGKTTLSGDVIVFENTTVTATGSAKLVHISQSSPIEPGTMRLDSIQAKSIRADLVEGKGKTLTLKEASASGGVIIEARRADRVTDPSGQPITVIRNVHATAESAKLSEGRDTVLLTGSVVVKITEPGRAEPVAVIDGQNVTYFLKANKIEIKGQPGKPAGLTVTSKEGKQK